MESSVHWTSVISITSNDYVFCFYLLASSLSWLAHFRIYSLNVLAWLAICGFLFCLHSIDGNTKKKINTKSIIIVHEIAATTYPIEYENVECCTWNFFNYAGWCDRNSSTAFVCISLKIVWRVMFILVQAALAIHIIIRHLIRTIVAIDIN